MDCVVRTSVMEGRENEKRSQALPTETAQESYGKLTKTDRQTDRERDSSSFSFCQLVEIIDQLTAKFNHFGFLIKTEHFLII